MNRYPMNYYQPLEMPYDRGSSRMLGRMLLFVLVALVLTAGAIGLVYVYRDATAAAHQAAVWEAEEQFLPARAQARSEWDIANLQAQARRALADADKHVAEKAEQVRLMVERNNLRLERERLLGEGLIYLATLTAAGGIVVATFTTIRLVDRRLPRLVSPRPAAASEAAPQPMRQAAPLAPAPLTLSVDNDAFRRAARESAPRGDGAGTKSQRPSRDNIAQPLPAH